MSDTLASSNQTNQPEDRLKEFDNWLHDQEDAHFAFRDRGAKALSKFRANQPLSDREAEVVERKVKEFDAADAQYLEMLGTAQYTDEFTRDQVLIEGIGTELLAHDEASHPEATE